MRRKKNVYQAHQRARRRQQAKRMRRRNHPRRWKINLAYLPAVGAWVFKIALVCLFAFVAVWYFGQRVSTVGDSM